jgi:eukaryotic-like serine/threonine-protein kinase
MNCSRCQNPLEEDSRSCPSCGLGVDSFCDSLAETIPTAEHENEATSVAGIISSDPLAGKVLGSKYQLIECVGEGGMGAVYRARRVHIGDEVAVKLLRPEFITDEQAVERFRREARAAAHLHHVNVVTIHDYGEVSGEGAHAFIVMEFVAGKSLRQLLRTEGRFPVERALALMCDICAGVGAAHRNNIIHRDLKPDNIIVVAPSADGEAERAKVVDFGIAKLRDLFSEHTLTRTGEVIGTPYYMSPEQCRGEALDARSDVYSLGAIMYEMLAGFPPFSAPTFAGVVAKHLTEQPPPLTSSLGVPRGVELVVTRALSKRPVGRQADAVELALDLRRAASSRSSPNSVAKVFGGRSVRGTLLKRVVIIISAIIIAGVVIGAAILINSRKERGLASPNGISPTTSSAAATDNEGRDANSGGGVVFTRVEASSTLSPAEKYAPQNIIDGRLETAWAEGAPGPGLGEWIVLTFKPQTVREVEVYPGYGKQPNIFYANNRLKRATLSFSDGTKVEASFTDELRRQTIMLDAPIHVSSLKLVIEDVYPGSQFNDTAISEINLR